jgi:hypothetical protein
MNTLGELQAACAGHVLSKVGLCGAPLPAATHVLDAEDHIRKVTDLVTRNAVRYAHRHRMKDSRRKARGMQRVAQKCQADIKCGFLPILAIIGESCISWLISEALSWLWNWFRGAGRATVSVMMDGARLCGWGSEPNEDIDDDDDE